MNLRELEKAATPSTPRWRVLKKSPMTVVGANRRMDAHPWIADTGTEADAVLIAAMRNALPLLLDVVEAARPLQEIAHHEYCTRTYHVEECERMTAALAALDAHVITSERLT